VCHAAQPAIVLLPFLQDPADYGELLGALREGGDAGPPAELRRRLAWKAFQHCATYDSTVAEWLWGQIGAPRCRESPDGSAGRSTLSAYLVASISSQQAVQAGSHRFSHLRRHLHAPPTLLTVRDTLHRLSTAGHAIDQIFWDAGGGAPAPEQSVPMRLLAGLRYGENPHQPAAAYLDASLAEAGRGGIARAAQHHGKEVRRCRARLRLGQPPVCMGRGVV
jgi:AICAR transformylase/IMP cyclohydrolase PurH